jgi:bzd-type benzoyl-CoA reductase N subunit
MLKGLQEILTEIVEIDRNLPTTKEIEEWKARGGKIIGWVCNWVPEEIIHAAGLLPVRVVGLSREVSCDDATAYLYTTTCSFVRTCFQMAHDGLYSYLDGFALASNCDQARRLYDVWEEYLDTPYKYILSVPHVKTEQAIAFFRREIDDFRKSLEQKFNVEISDVKIKQSIDLYDEKRSLLRRINETRKRERPPITGAQMLALMNVGNKMPVEDFNALLRTIAEMTEQAGDAVRPLGDVPRLMVSGSCINNVNYVKFIEDQGAIVVADDTCTGVRYWWDNVNVAPGGDPLRALSERYLKRFPCARCTPGEERFEAVVGVAKEYGVQGVVQEMIRYCTPTAWERPWLRRSLEQEGIRVLPLEILYGAEGTGQLKVRIQAFLEMLGGNEDLYGDFQDTAAS